MSQTIVHSGQEISFRYKDKKMGALQFMIVDGVLYCEDWGRKWRFIKMERNGEQWLYRFENGEKVREYNLQHGFLDKVFELTGVRIPLS